MLEQYDKPLWFDDFYVYRERCDGNIISYVRWNKKVGHFPLFHRLDGPAKVSLSIEEYWIDGRQYSKQEFDNLDSFFLNTV